MLPIAADDDDDDDDDDHPGSGSTRRQPSAAGQKLKTEGAVVSRRPSVFLACWVTDL